MSKKVKSLLLVLCALVFAVAGVFATLAYLQDDDVVDNTVTIGDITMDLDEGTFKEIDPYTGEIEFDFGEREQDGNEYHLIPGVTYPKDPTVHINKGSEPCYVFVQVNNGLEGLEVDVAERTLDDGTVLPEGMIAAQMEANNWVKVDGYKNLWVYKANTVDGKPYIVDAKNIAEETLDLQVFGQFKVNADANNGGNPDIDEYKDAHITVKAFAIQTVGFPTYQDALSQLPAGWEGPIA